MSGFSVEQYISDEIEFTSRDEAVALLSKKASKHGGKHIAFGIMNPGTQSARLAFDAISTYSEDWTQRYFQQNYHILDPILKKATSAKTPFDWNASRYRSNREKEFFGESIEHGLGQQGFAVPVLGPNGALCVLSFNADVPDKEWLSFREEVLPHILLFAHQFNAKALNIRAPQIEEAQLSPREIEVLKWAAEGKSVWETAQILTISYHSVKSYLQNGQRKLQCTNKLHTVVTAVRRGII
ncbi:helix-turn-helix transcriptional regulator [Maritalea sp.]|jgi:DNA-binding CsgD family transcriptional regulator|uniref:helix-turn-helix transcriptional regulator n=1 Tax=Maritalea sp. TaxID=2003361 RepID=UPI0039E71094